MDTYKIKNIDKLLGPIPKQGSESKIESVSGEDDDSISSNDSPKRTPSAKINSIIENTWYISASLKIISTEKYPNLQTLLETLQIWGDFYCGPQSLKSLYTVFLISLGLHIRETKSTSHSYLYESGLSERICFRHKFEILSDTNKTFIWSKVVPHCRYNTSIRFECTLTDSKMPGKSFRLIHKTDHVGRKTIPSLKNHLKPFGIKVQTREGEYQFET
uniref:Matrix protein n=1 Tax=Bactrocera tryoni rhabdovirus 1 TaxID=2795014 RepID=A0A8A6RHF1_9RHAB|nr:matrix protein [Bactrocera tryoni rhabdovirus 1]